MIHPAIFERKPCLLNQSCADLERFSLRTLKYWKCKRLQFTAGSAFLLTAQNASPLDRLFRLKASCTSQSNILCCFTQDQVLSLCNVITAACFSQSLACVYASWSHTQHSPGTMWYAFTTCTAALVCLLPPSESLICLQCSATCCVYSPAAPPALILIRATIVFPFLHES